MTNTIETINEIDNETVGAFIREIIGTSTIAEQFKDDDDKKVTRIFNLAAVDFPLIAIKRILEYGMQRLPNDSVSGWDDYANTEEKMEAVANLLADLKNGIVKKARSSAIAITDVAKLARQKARVAVKIMYTESKEHDYKRDFLDGLTTAEQNDYLDSVIADDDQYTIAAQLEIDNRSKAKETISLLELPKAKA